MKFDSSVCNDGSKWRCALLLAAAVLCIALGAGCPDSKSKAANEAAAAEEEKSTEDASLAEEQSAEEGDYTYECYEGDRVPYYRGYYYVGGAWVWRGRGAAPCPPPQFRPVQRSKSVPPKSAPAKAVRVKRAPAKSAPRHGGVRAPKGPRR